MNVPQTIENINVLPKEMSFHHILNTERKATALLLAKNHRPNITFKMNRIDPPTMGKLILLFEMTTAFLGYFLHIDPFDQPGVEWGKKMAKSLLGFKGVETMKSEMDPIPNFEL